MATSKLQEYTYKRLVENFSQYTIKFNYRPDWLISSDNKRLELDIYIQQLSIGIEVNGDQHYKFIPFFHKNKEGYQERLRLDREKKDMCIGKGIRFVEATSKTDIDNLITELCGHSVSPKESLGYTSALQQKTLKAIEKTGNRKWKNNTLHASSLVAKCIRQYNIGLEKELDLEITSYYFTHRAEVDKLV